MHDRDGRGEPGEPEATAPELVPRRGRMRHQDETTRPRQPTLAERRARERAARLAEDRRLADEVAGAKRRRRVLVGAGVTVGVVALIAVGYSAAQPQEEITAQCVDEETGVIVDDSNCATPAPNTPYYGGVGGFYPIFIGLGGRQYHYNYGGTGTVGQPVSGGTTVVPPDGTRVRTSSGSSTVSRGGLGVSRRSTSGGSVGGSKSGGSVRSGTGGSKSAGG